MSIFGKLSFSGAVKSAKAAVKDSAKAVVEHREKVDRTEWLTARLKKDSPDTYKKWQASKKDLDGDGEINAVDLGIWLKQEKGRFATLKKRSAFFRGVASYDKKIKWDNPLHTYMHMMPDKAAAKEKTYRFLGKTLKRARLQLKPKATKKQKLASFYKALQQKGVRYKGTNETVASGLTGKKKTLDCDRYSVVVMGMAFQEGIRTYLVEVPGHMFLRAGKNKDDNVDIGKIGGRAYFHTYKYYQDTYRIRPAAIRKRAHLAPMNWEETLSAFYSMRAGAKDERGDWIGVKQDATKALSLNRNNTFAISKLAESYLYHKDYAKALKLYDRLREFGGAGVDIHNAYECLFKLGKFKRIHRALRSVIKRFPRNPLVHHRFGRLYLAQKKYKLAATHFRQAILYGMRSATDYFNVGKALYLAGNYKEANIYLTKAIQKDRKFAGAYHLRGEARDKLGYDELAKKDYDVGLRLTSM